MFFGMDEREWYQVCLQARSIPNLAAWVKSVLDMPFEAIMALAAGDHDTGDVEVSASVRKVSDSYLGFLQEQITLAARGPEWTDVLTRRLDALRSYANVPLWVIAISQGGQSFYLRIDPQSFRIVHWEVL